MNILAVVNQKGGTGKTSLAIHLAYFLLERQKKVIFIDCDPSGDATSTLLQGDITLKGQVIPVDDIEALTASDLFEPGYRMTSVGEALTVFAGTKLLIDIDKSCIEHFADNISFVNESFGDDVICIIDGGPTAGVLQFATLVVANHMVVPIELDRYSLNATDGVAATIDNIHEYNPGLEFIGVIPNRVNRVSPKQIELLQQLQVNHPDTLLGEDLYVSQRQAVRDALDNNQPVWSLRKESARLVGKEIIAVANAVFIKMGVLNDE